MARIVVACEQSAAGGTAPATDSFVAKVYRQFCYSNVDKSNGDPMPGCGHNAAGKAAGFASVIGLPIPTAAVTPATVTPDAFADDPKRLRHALSDILK